MKLENLLSIAILNTWDMKKEQTCETRRIKRRHVKQANSDKEEKCKRRSKMRKLGNHNSLKYN